ncbi:hypothetical protein BDP55DRAFT_101551 [Colletotrichum godetiae]|uniref:C2H2-type domain-containing protein n=1 Tax=Colletotrichum godetiae TaxID=1209918 RepID=A0AAJ0EZ43_9PEZI|nr:uncharacterized protein BDP55DRAFT_101551 [Colletotrichum godetiae]KAK1676825.1 hypothetical protein BDP55DRAFT_101551 [Colletotrichum godetiae]
MEVREAWMGDRPTAWSSGYDIIREITIASPRMPAESEDQERMRTRQRESTITSIHSRYPLRTISLPQSGNLNIYEGKAGSGAIAGDAAVGFSATTTEKYRGNRPSSAMPQSHSKDGGSEPPEPPGASNMNEVGTGKGKMRFFACHYVKYDPSQCGCCSRTAACEFPTIRRLKEHLLRSHTVPSSRTETGSTPGRQTSSTPRELSSGPSNLQHVFATEATTLSAGLSPSKAAAIRDYCEQNPLREWYRIWDIVFPGKPQPASPYIDRNSPVYKPWPPRVMPDLVRSRRRQVPRSDVDVVDSSGEIVSGIDAVSGRPSSATLEGTKTFRNISGLVFRTLQILEERLEIAQCQKTGGRGGGKAPSRKRGRQSEDQQGEQQQLSKRHAGSRKQQTAPCQNNNEPPDDDDPDNLGPEGDQHSSRENTEQRFLACPFFRKDSERYAACAMLHLRRIRDVKQHMRRGHSRPAFYCPICWKTFQRRDDCDGHIVERSCDAGDASGPPWMTEEQDSLLEGRVPNAPTEDQWFSVWDIACPGLPRPRPAFCFLGRMVEDISTMRRELWREEGHHIVEDLVSEREASLQQPLTEENRNLVVMCIIGAVSRVLEQPEVAQAGQIRWNSDGDDQVAVAAAPAPVPPPQNQTLVHDAHGHGSNTIQYQSLEMQDNFLQDGHTRITDESSHFNGTQLGGLATQWWDSSSLQPTDADEFDAAIFNEVLQSFGDSYPSMFNFADGADGA